LPHRGHRSPNIEISFTKLYHHKTYKLIPQVFIPFLTYKYIGNYQNRILIFCLRSFSPFSFSILLAFAALRTIRMGSFSCLIGHGLE
jgi:hypothetical protein